MTLKTEMAGDHVMVVTLNRPEVLNAINTEMGRAMLALWSGLAGDPGPVRCVVLTGAGDRAFCAGGDLKQRDGMADADWRSQHDIFERAFMALVDLPVPVICAANGLAYGGGLETLLACDFAYGVTGARFALSETRLGIMPGGGGTLTLPRAIGGRRAKEMIYCAQPCGAEQALAWGILNRVVAPPELMAAALVTATTIAANGPLAISQAKKSIDVGLESDLRNGYRFAIEAYGHLVGSQDRLEGVRAFNDKRKPDFRGR